MTDWTTTTATGLGAAFDTGAACPRDVTEQFLDKIAAHPQADRIYARLTPDRARAEASAAADRAARGMRLSPLDGVPISWKDLFDTAGTATEAGSALLRGRVPGQDAQVLRAATAQGLVCLGKTHMSELAFSGLGLNPITATPPCVNDAEAVPGGSSSGAAASVAFGLAAAAIGSDTGGSVRIPAAWNDLVGLKTTAGQLSLRGVVPLAARFDTVGPLCRSVEDAAHVLAALEGRSSGLDLRGAGRVGGLRLGILDSIVQDDLRPEPAAAWGAAVQALQAARADLPRFEAPELAGAIADAGILYTTEAWATWGHAIEADPDAMFPPIRDRFAAGQAHAGHAYLAAWARLEEARAAWAARTAGFDAVICPTAPNLPPSAARLLSDDAYYVTENLLTLRNTRVGNLMGLCALSLPSAQPSCGVMVMAPAGAEARLLRLGAALAPVLAG